MYLTRSFSRVDAPLLQPKTEFADFFELFDFTPRVNWTKKSLVADTLENDPSFIADLAASVVRQLHESKCLREETVIRYGLEFCMAVLQDRGYGISSVDQLHGQTAREDHHNIMMVAGCQGKEILRARVACAFDFLSQVHAPFTVVFSGKNPSKTGYPKVRTLNEARTMEDSYYSLLKTSGREQGWPHKVVKIEVEDESRDSRANVTEFFKRNLLDTKKDNHVFLVSSSFHLIKLSLEFENQAPNSSRIAFITLLGSEHPASVSVAASVPGYLKSMFFQVYSVLLEERRRFSGLAKHVQVSGDQLEISLRDGRKLLVPLERLPEVRNGDRELVERCVLTGNGVAISWPDLGQVIAIETLLSKW